MCIRDSTLKCSHTFNVLQARGVVSQTERAAYIGRIRDLARGCAENWLASRQAKGFPMLTGPDRAHFVAAAPAPDAANIATTTTTTTSTPLAALGAGAPLAHP